MALVHHAAGGRQRRRPRIGATRNKSASEPCRSVCEGLRRPHVEGWIHRDIKPGNLLLLDGRWVVGDWGQGRRPRGETSDPRRTRTGTGFGTEGFAAPELSDDAHEVTPATDIYSLGQLVGALLTGSSPHWNRISCTKSRYRLSSGRRERLPRWHGRPTGGTRKPRHPMSLQ